MGRDSRVARPMDVVAVDRCCALYPEWHSTYMVNLVLVGTIYYECLIG